VSKNPNDTSQYWLQRLGQVSPVYATTSFIGGVIADASAVYIRPDSNAIRVPFSGGMATIGNGSGTPAAVNSTRVFLTDGGPSSPSSFAVYSVPLNSIGSARTLVGDYGTQADFWTGVVADETHVYWSAGAYAKVTNAFQTFIWRCPVTGCGGAEPTIIAQGDYPTEVFKTDGTALYMMGPGGIYKVAK
jgi:hypothetical protein